MKYALTFALLLPFAAHSETCPVAPDITQVMDDLIARAQIAPDEMAGRAVSNQMWQQWIKAPDEYSQGLLDEGMDRRGVYDLDGAEKAFTALTQYCPFYAEGYNQRAFVHFLRGDHALALPDLEKALELRPRHVAALAGKALTLIGMDRIAEGQAVLRDALKLNPWLSERSLLSLDPNASNPDGETDL